MKDGLSVFLKGNLKIKDANTGELIVDKDNAIHPRNMARIVARALSNEPNAIIKRMAFGNGATYIDSVGNTIYRTPNTGTERGWESRLYNETYSEIVDEEDVDFKTDPGSADINNVRPGGGSSEADDPSGGGVTSVEVGLKSNVIISVFLNENEPTSQLATDAPIPSLDEEERCFLFDEIGLYSPGKQAVDTSGYASVYVGNSLSSDNSPFSGSEVLELNITVDGVDYTSTITVPATGSGGGGEITYGDICEGINSGSWVTGDPIQDYCYVYITDMTDGDYPTIIGEQSYGFLIFESQTTGATSTVSVTCDAVATDFFYLVAGNDCANCNIDVVAGDVAGVANDSLNPENERERLLTHVVFDPVLKSGNRALEIIYTISVSTASNESSLINIVGP